MFSNELGRDRFHFSAAPATVLIASTVLITVAASIVSARTIPYLLGVLAGLCLTTAIVTRKLGNLFFKPNELHWSIAALLVWSAATTIWSPNAQLALVKIGIAATLLFACSMVTAAIMNEPRSGIVRIAEGLWLGLMIGLTYFLVETLSHQSIKISVYNTLGLGPDDLKPPGFFIWENGRLVDINNDDMTRNTTPITLLVWPAVLAAISSTPASRSRFVATVLGGLTLAAVIASTHEASKVALAVGLIAFLLARHAPSWTNRLMAAGWLIGCLGMLPLALLAHRLDLHNAAWLQPTAQIRISIWHQTAERTLAQPFLGIGVHGTYVVGPTLGRTNLTAAGELRPPGLSRHAHNIYLQTWLELGLVGAILLSGVGLCLLRIISRLRSELRPYAHATFACAAVIAGLAYGMWQIWYMSLFGLAITMFAVGARAQETHASVWTTPRGADL